MAMQVWQSDDKKARKFISIEAAMEFIDTWHNAPAFSHVQIWQVIPAI